MWDLNHTCNPTFFKSCAWLPKNFFGLNWLPTIIPISLETIV